MEKPWGRGIVFLATSITVVVVVPTIMLLIDPSLPTSPWQAKAVVGICLAIFWTMAVFLWWVAATGKADEIDWGTA